MGGQVGGQPSSHASGRRHDQGPEAGAVNDAAVAAYRLSVQAGNPAVGAKARSDVRAYISPLGACQDRRGAASTVSGARREPSTSHEPLTLGSAPRLGPIRAAGVGTGSRVLVSCWRSGRWSGT